MEAASAEGYGSASVSEPPNGAYELPCSCSPRAEDGAERRALGRPMALSFRAPANDANEIIDAAKANEIKPSQNLMTNPPFRREASAPRHAAR